MRAISLSLILAAACLFGSSISEAEEGADTKRPNVLLLILEDWGPYLGCYGQKEMFTPNLDALASEGRLYRNCFSMGPVCSVGRSSLMTGMSQYTTHAQQHRTSEAAKQ